MKDFLSNLPKLIGFLESGVTLTGTKSERVSKFFDVAEQISMLVSASFAMATSRGESPRAGGVTATPGAMSITAAPEPMSDDQALAALRHLAGSPAAKSVVARKEGEAASLSMPDFGSIQFLPLAEWGIRKLFTIAQDARARKKRSDAKPESEKKSAKNKSK